MWIVREVSERLGRGSRLPAADTAMGRLLLAHSMPDRRHGALGTSAAEQPPQSQEDVHARKKLSEELERLREKQFVIAENVRVKGERCVASVVRGRSSEVVGAVDVAAPKLTFSRVQMLEQLAPLVVASAEEMSRHLGYKP
jgi:IclR family transcriptional regulator, pca regulon regulatory protein